VTRPGKPTDNANLATFNGRLKDECLNVYQFPALDDVRGSEKTANL
jgi:putative transposase